MNDVFGGNPPPPPATRPAPEPLTLPAAPAEEWLTELGGEWALPLPAAYGGLDEVARAGWAGAFWRPPSREATQADRQARLEGRLGAMEERVAAWLHGLGDEVLARVVAMAEYAAATLSLALGNALELPAGEARTAALRRCCAQRHELECLIEALALVQRHHVVRLVANDVDLLSEPPEVRGQIRAASPYQGDAVQVIDDSDCRPLVGRRISLVTT